MHKSIPVAIATVFLSACSYMAIETAPKKTAGSIRSSAALKADELFWEIFHAGNYEKIPAALEPLTAAYLEDPNDAFTAAHIGWLHIWRLAERARLEKIPAAITDDATLARKYFQQAVALAPTEARFSGFYAGATLAEGTIDKDEKQIRTGYYALHAAVEAWPEFNLFTAGYMLSQQPADSELFKEGLDMQWRNLDVCAGETVNRQQPNYASYLSLQTSTGKKRVCWNSWIAPHNLEGFFLNMGDMLVKAGDWQLAQQIYANAKLSPDYSSWKFQEILENRIQNAQHNSADFNAGPEVKNAERMMFSSSYNCMACHQQ